MVREVEFIWWSSRKIWKVYGKDLKEIMQKAESMCYKYHAVHFQIL